LVLHLILGFGVSDNLPVPWDAITAYAPFAVAGLVTAVIGSVRRRRFPIPAGVAYLPPFLKEPVPLAMMAIAWVLFVGSTAVIRWLGAGSSPHKL
jgi:hypothetical protein